jgi:hypothetical protein
MNLTSNPQKPGKDPVKHGNETTYAEVAASENKVQYIVLVS